MCDLCVDAGKSRHRLVWAPDGVASAASTEAPPERAANTPEAALKLLIEGNGRYVVNEPLERDFSAGRASRTLGQAPFAAILGCADSRVSPELAFDQSPGDLFVVRVAGNFVTDEGLASLEFGSAVLGTKIIVVLGHTSCGAVNATVTALQQGNTLPGHIADLVRSMAPGVWPALGNPEHEIADEAVIANVRHNVARLKEAGPILADMIVNKQLDVVGAVYDLATGKVNFV